MLVPPVSFNPEKVITRPSPSAVTVGYQRPCAIFSTSVNVPSAGSKIVLRGWPWNGSYCRLPPLTRMRPSDNATMPLQNMSHASDCVVIVLACRSHTAARKFVSAATLPEPETISTLPSYVTAM